MICSVWLWHFCSGQQIYRIARGQGRGMEEARKVPHPFPLPKGFKAQYGFDLIGTHFFSQNSSLFPAPVIYRQCCHSWYYSNENSFFLLTIIIFSLLCLVACLSRVWTWWSHPSSWTFSSKRNSVNSIKCSAGSQKESKIMIISSCCT